MVMRSLLALAALAALAACSSEPPLPPAQTAKAIRVEHVRVKYAAAFAPGESQLPPTEATRLNTFLDQSGMAPGDRAYVAASSSDPLASARVGRIASLLALHGLGIEPVAPPPGGIEPNQVLVLVDRYVAEPPACPDWSDDPSGTHDNTTSSNYGCATLNNLAQMIANPRDLDEGRDLAPANGDVSADAMLRYRTGAVLPLSSQSASGGASSSSGASAGMSSSAPSQ